MFSLLIQKLYRSRKSWVETGVPGGKPPEPVIVAELQCLTPAEVQTMLEQPNPGVMIVGELHPVPDHHPRSLDSHAIEDVGGWGWISSSSGNPPAPNNTLVEV